MRYRTNDLIRPCPCYFKVSEGHSIILNIGDFHVSLLNDEVIQQGICKGLTDYFDINDNGTVPFFGKENKLNYREKLRN